MAGRVKTGACPIRWIALAETLAVDFDGVVIPDGERHTNLLMNNAHGKRLVNAFLREDAPALVIGSAVAMTSELGLVMLLLLTNPLEANRVTAPADADVNEMIDKFDLAMRNSSNEDKAA